MADLVMKNTSGLMRLFLISLTIWKKDRAQDQGIELR